MAVFDLPGSPGAMVTPTELVAIASSAVTTWTAQLSGTSDRDGIVGVLSRQRTIVRLAKKLRGGSQDPSGRQEWYVAPDQWLFVELPAGFNVWLRTAGSNNGGQICVWFDPAA